MSKPCILLPRPLLSPGLLPRCGLFSKNANPLYLHGGSSRAFSLAMVKLTVPTINPTRVLYKPIEDVERMKYYQPGGYHPGTIGDRLHDRYRVIHKLGHGTYSTIWLARD
ncbi:hypothetical protein BO82DRAFT_425296 [Aspergillus uvarum CBS 121591]|uniref:non-specific serine/threonine protein kinase n=1 Tax=Aspergillus uvarum CBS 121591 TaxID=1448315 RepID=A0A319BVT8_9EURO|nr:hypothetical protein BO82DRAFT_425296 [Aspergillus uvarum CBS 121591]PYH76785.1 hypothetical protein BO82DRAFT_425296 [Aspergillus uvarum CBS 121591]